ncbi:MAG: DUF2723 domain-containing protein [Candidatus Eisenbacteria bacterium]|nr:DUF2723 domain-containing protein [Candidatus Eisenbacteria bacterium]
MRGTVTGAADPDASRTGSSGRARLEAAAVGVAAACLFAATASRDLAAGDAGELLLAARSLGIPHPPGYPLWVWLAGLFGHVAPGPFAWRVALLSAVSAAVGLALLYRLAVRSGAGRAASALAVTGLALTPLFWSTAGSVEVYALAFAVNVAAAWALCGYARRGGAPRLFAASAACGLALVAHQSAALLLPVAAAGILPRLRTQRTRWKPLLGGLAAGLSPFLWLPLRAAQHPALNWGNDASPGRLFANLTRACYGGLTQNTLEAPRLAREAGFFASFQASQWGLVAAVMALAGLAVWAGRSRRAAALAALALIALPAGLALLLRFEPDPVHTFQVSQFLLPMTAVMALGLAHALGFALRTPLRAPVLALALAWLAGSAFLNRPATEPAGGTLARRYGQDLLAALPPGATLFVEGDNETFTLAWLQKGEGLRPDVRVIHRRGHVFEDPYGLAGLPRREWPARQRAVEARLIASGPGPWFCAGEMPVPPGFASVPEGLVRRIVRSPAPARPDRVPGLPVTLAEARRGDFVTRKVAVAYLEGAARKALQTGPMDRAVHAYRQLAYVAYDFPEARYDLGRVLSMAGQAEAARAEMRAALLLAPNEGWLRAAAREMGVRTS